MKRQINHPLLAIALTGNIGSGKTTAAKIFEELGATIYYADTIAKDLMVSDKQIVQDIKKQFGDQAYAPDGTLNREFLSAEIFASKAKREALNAIVHPAVIDAVQDIIEREEKLGKKEVIIFEAALIFEAGMAEMFDYVLLVTADDETAMKRVMARDKISKEEIERRMNAQTPASKKTGMADFVIENSGNLETLRMRCTFIYTLLKSMGVQSSGKA